MTVDTLAEGTIRAPEAAQERFHPLSHGAPKKLETAPKLVSSAPKKVNNSYTSILFNN